MAKQYRLIHSADTILLAVKIAVRDQGKYLWDIVDIFAPHEADKAQAALIACKQNED